MGSEMCIRDSNQGWEMFFSNHMPVVPNGLFDAFLDGVTMNMFYEDDANSTTKYEHDPGATPRLGFQRAKAFPTP